MVGDTEVELMGVEVVSVAARHGKCFSFYKRTSNQLFGIETQY